MDQIAAMAVNIVPVLKDGGIVFEKETTLIRHGTEEKPQPVYPKMEEIAQFVSQ
jgi:hypothetical protein